MKKTITLLILLLLPTGVWGSALEVVSIIKPGPPPARKVIYPKSARKDFPLDGYIELPPPDLEPILAEDGARQTAGKGPLRVGFFRELTEPVFLSGSSAPGVKTRSGGEIRVFVIHSPGAEAIRLEVSGIGLPEGAEFTVYDYLDPAGARGPFGRAYWEGRDRFWTESIFSDFVAMELYLPPAAEGEAEFRVDRIVHIYRSLTDLAGERSAPGPCHNDVMCAEAAWRETANAVAGIGTIGDEGYLWCTGALLNNTASDFTDYFMTAHHCVGSQAEADTIEFYWFYQTPSCDGTPPDPATVPRTSGGAVFLAGRPSSTANDFAFLRLRQASPPGVTYLGWSAAAWGSGTPVRGIHHPDGDFKRISYGNLAGSDANYWDVLWHDGSTEPGSSGSPLLDEAGRRFIGQLYGGWASCDNMAGLDFYGRFDKSWPLIEQWLNSPAPKVVSGDYSGDGRSEAAIFRSASGLWAIRGLTRFYYGQDGDFPISADYNGDGTANPAVFRPANRLWAIRGLTRFYFGQPGDLPAAADYRGNGTAGPGIFRGSTGLWAIRDLTRVYFGRSGDIPLPGDYTGDGTSRAAFFRPADGLWAIWGLTRFYYGRSVDTPVPGDYSVSGRLFPAIFRPGNGLWAARGLTRIYWGRSSDRPVPADYSGSGRDVVGIFRGSSGLWALRGFSRLYFGQSGDLPVSK